jgi:hypothetical protein
MFRGWKRSGHIVPPLARCLPRRCSRLRSPLLLLLLLLPPPPPPPLSIYWSLLLTLSLSAN